MKLVEHPSLVTEPIAKEADMNVEDGLAGIVLDRILRERSRSEGAKKAAEKRKSSSASIVENIQKSQQLTSGVLTKNSIHSLSDPRFLDPFRQRQKETAEREQVKMSKRKAKFNKVVSAVKMLCMKYGHEKTHMFQPCDKNECGAYLQYKK